LKLIIPIFMLAFAFALSLTPAQSDDDRVLTL